MTATATVERAEARSEAAQKRAEALHADAIESLAEETHQPVNVVADIYDEQLARLNEKARVKDFLVLFAMRRTRDVLLRIPPATA